MKLIKSKQSKSLSKILAQHRVPDYEGPDIRSQLLQKDNLEGRTLESLSLIILSLWGIFLGAGEEGGSRRMDGVEFVEEKLPSWLEVLRILLLILEGVLTPSRLAGLGESRFPTEASFILLVTGSQLFSFLLQEGVVSLMMFFPTTFPLFGVPLLSGGLGALYDLSGILLGGRFLGLSLVSSLCADSVLEWSGRVWVRGRVRRGRRGVGVDSWLGGGSVWLWVKCSVAVSSPQSLAAWSRSNKRTRALVPSSSMLFSSSCNKTKSWAYTSSIKKLNNHGTR